VHIPVAPSDEGDDGDGGGDGDGADDGGGGAYDDVDHDDGGGGDDRGVPRRSERDRTRRFSVFTPAKWQNLR
jgi:hypothetical protein